MESFVLLDLGVTESEVSVVDLSEVDEKRLNIALNKIDADPRKGENAGRDLLPKRMAAPPRKSRLAYVEFYELSISQRGDAGAVQR